ncbi:homeobox-leucine zipper protein HOX11-like [Ananas comosus]|uniref:Homeobox-leucine zipper protein HOX11-like n=1 Tax=Ananas comosus TaxID=4615 RepID=A0A6P5FAN9_ANACO|nr:homeobox-leucine zipper protein HOX11-like [Ananas comosus]
MGEEECNIALSLAIGERKRSKSEDSSKGASDANGGGARKKLRLSKEQLALLEDSFRAHNTLYPVQKQELAQQLNLRPRQVEVWFQNRRARCKLKQTEVDCEYLKRCCESLTDENHRLKRELMELRSAMPAVSLPFNVPIPRAVAALRMCPSCERIATDRDEKRKA